MAGELKPVNLGYERTRMAADRTLMAWIRTSVSMITFGFTIYKFFQYLMESDVVTEKFPHYAPRNFGVALVVLGMVMLALAIVEYYLFLRMASLLLSLLGILVLMNLLFRMGPI